MNEFTWADRGYSWLSKHATGWQFGESGVLKALADHLGLLGYCVEIGAGNGDSLPVTCDPLIKAGRRAVLFEKDEPSRENLRIMYAGYPVEVCGEYWKDKPSTSIKFGEIAVLVIDIDGDDWRVLLQAANRLEGPAVIMCEHANRTGNQSVFLLQDGKEQATAEHLIGIASRSYDCIGYNFINSIFVRRDLADHVRKQA